MVDTPNYWIFVVSDQRLGSTLLEAQDILRNRLRHGFWAFGPRARGAHALRPGDHAVIYVAGQHAKGFAGTCTVRSNAQPLLAGQRKLVAAETKHLRVELADCIEFPALVSVPTIANQLQFIKKKEHWGTYLQGSAIRIPQADYVAIVQATNSTPKPAQDERCPPHVWSYEAIPMHGEPVTLSRCIVCGAQQRDQ